MENSQASNDGVLTQDHNNDLPQMPATNGGAESEHELSAEEVKGALEIIASTGKFWHNWDELKSMLVFQLKQVLSEYPEATKGDDQQNSSLGESYLELAQRLEAALFSFIEGPPFTLQRLCEILLNARTIYPNLSKLALALEKNLLVTSTITKSTDPYPSSMMTVPNAPEEHVEDAQRQPEPQQQPKPEPEPQQPEPEPQQPEPEPQPQQPEPEPQPQQPEPEPEPEPEPQQPQPQPHSNSVENGGELATGDRDEVMSEVDTHVDDSMTIDMETFEEIISSSEGNPEPVIDS